MAVVNPFASKSAPASGTSTPSKGVINPFANKPVASTPDTQKYTDYLRSGYGASNITDTSGAPLLTFRNDAAKKSQLLSDRTYSGDPTVAKPGSVQNQRMPVAQSQAIKKSLGGTSSTELDHIQPLELGGSNQKSNLRIENHQLFSNNTATDPIENQVADQVKAGKLTQLQGWQQIAKAKGITLAEAQRMTPVLNGGKSVVPKPPTLGEKITNIANKGLETVLPGLDYAEQTTSEVAGALQKGVDSVKGKGINNLVNTVAPKLADAVGQQVVMHPVKSFMNLANEIGQQEDAGIHRLVDAVTTFHQHVALDGTRKIVGGQPVSRTQALADTANLLNAGASLALMPVSVPFEIGSKLPVFAPAFKAVGVVFDQAGKVSSYEADKTLQMIPDSILSKEQKSVLAQPIHDVSSLAGQILLGGEVLHGITAFTEATGKPLTDAEVTQLADRYHEQAKEINTHASAIEAAVKSGDVAKINAALKSVDETISEPKKTETTAKESAPISKELQPLAEEARQYTTPEDFVKAQGEPIYRGAPDESMLKDKGRGISFSSSKDVADRFSTTDSEGFPRNGKVGQFFVDSKAKVLDANTLTAKSIGADLNRENIIQYARDNGYDVVNMKDAISPKTGFKSEAEIRVLNPDVLKTASQLTDLYHQAVGETPKVVEGNKQSGFAKSLADEASKQGTKVEETADYRSSTEKEQADLFKKMAESGIDNVRAIVRGDAPLPEYARGGSFLFELEKYLKDNPGPDNAEIAYEMANSPLATGVSESASEIGLLQKRHQDSYTAKVDDLKRKLTEAAGGKEKVAQSRKSFKEKASKVLLPKEELSWDRFLDSIQC